MGKKHGFKLGDDLLTYTGTENVRSGILESQPRLCQGLSNRRASSTYKCVSVWNWQCHHLARQESNYSIATAMQILPLKLNYKFDLYKFVITMLTTALLRNEVRAAAIPRQINHETGDNIIFFPFSNTSRFVFIESESLWPSTNFLSDARPQESIESFFLFLFFPKQCLLAKANEVGEYS